MNFNQESIKISQNGSHDTMARPESKMHCRDVEARQTLVVAITAYSCTISRVLKHASFSSNFSENPRKNPGRSRLSARIRGNEGASDCLSRCWKKSPGLWRSSARSIPLRLLMAEWARKRAKPCSATVSPAPHTLTNEQGRNWHWE